MTSSLTECPLLATRLPRFALLVLCLGPGCNREAGTPAKTAAAVPAKIQALSTTKYQLAGVVKRVDASAGRVWIAHKAIPGFMDAMTMPFTLKDRSLLEDVKPGDEVEGPLRVEREGDVVKDYELEDLVVMQFAPAPVHQLRFSTGPKRLEVGEAVPDFAMTDQEGRALKLSDFKGKVVVLTFIYTRCPLPDFCPLMDRKFAELAGKLDALPGRAEQVRLLSVSFDPEHDTPEVLRKHARVVGATLPRWTFAVATEAELAKVAAPLGLAYGPAANEIMHNLCTAVIDQNGRLARLDAGASGKTWQPSELFKLIASLTKSATKRAADGS